MSKADREEEYKQVDKFIVTSKILGKGSFGVVYRGFFEKDHSKIVAVKVTPLEKISSDLKFLELLKREIEIMQSIDHANIVRMYAATRTSRNLYMFLEFCRDGDLKELMRKRGGTISESEALTYFRQVIKGFKILFQNKIIHRDIKPANILLHEGVAKITDFGFARVIEGDMDTSGQFSKVGTPLYMSPQILNDQKFSAKTDIWSLGMMLYEMLYGKTPWTANSPYQLFENINTYPLDFPDKPIRSQEVKDLLKLMLIVEDRERISWIELFNHPLCKFDPNSLKANIEKIEEEKDSLIKSAAINKLYVQNNKVMGFKKNEEVTKVFKKNEKEEDKKPEEPSEKIYDNNYDNVISKQDQDQHERIIIMKVDSFFSNQRNIAIFVNYTSTLLFNVYSAKKFPLSDSLFYKIFFLLQKLQMSIFHTIILLMSGKSDVKIFNSDHWNAYLKSPEFTTTQQAIKTDGDFMIPYFKEVLKRTKEITEKTLAKEENADIKKSLKSILMLLEDKEAPENFEEIFKENLLAFIEYLKENVVKKNLKDKEAFLVIRLLLFCLNRQEEFKWDVKTEGYDFHKFYENYENMEDKVLKEEVLSYLK